MNSDEDIEQSNPKVACFYIDETLLEIENKKHVIVCAISPHNPSDAAMEMVKVKKSLGFSSLDEVKMNTGGLTRELKVKLTDGVIGIMSDCTAFISIIEGEDKQKAAEMIALQVFDYCNQSNIEGYSFYFDKDLVPKPRDFEQFVRTELVGEAECIGIQHLNSTGEQMIQCCDVFLSLYRLSLEIEFGNRVISRMVYIYENDEGNEWSLSRYVILFTRGQIWGKRVVRDICATVSEQEFDSFHCSYGLGVRVDSTISPGTKKIIENELATTYTGCIF